VGNVAWQVIKETRVNDVHPTVWTFFVAPMVHVHILGLIEFSTMSHIPNIPDVQDIVGLIPWQVSFRALIDRILVRILVEEVTLSKWL
jgi:hypothetical protein